MNINKLILTFLISVFSVNVWAYGSSSSKKACRKPKFTQFLPSHLSVVAPQSEFSFLSSEGTNPASIEVRVKKQLVEVSVDKMSNGYSVSGKLPASLQGTYARIDIKAKGTNSCKAKDGWLLNIEAQAQ